MARRLGTVLVIGALVAGAAVAHQTGWFTEFPPFRRQARAEPPAVAPASALVPVEVAPARQATTTTDIHSIGTLQSDESVKVAAEIAGRIAEIGFREGEAVKAGAVLVKLDDALVLASRNEIKARLELAIANYERAERLSRTGSGTARALDEAMSERNTASALVNTQEVQLAKHSIVAPFDGVVGLRGVSVGAYVSPGTELVNLEKIDVLKVDFSVPESALRAVSAGQEVAISVDAFPDRLFTGEVYAIDPLVDVNGRSLRVRGRLANPDRVLRPGLFARIVVKGEVPRTAVFVPEAAVVPRGQERLVWQVDAGKAVERPVKLGERRAGEVEIVEGLAPGATVVIAGQGRLRDGAGVEVVPTPPAPQG
ncbi:efflux RND transporter periplasmic adaptor subunit [Ancylobacter sp. 6x-1]|uniref:Efflux RND transporter periplasmic adaptor subunit n=1 Tax=Ancylobacter crimeensis TaxID=2579147 RepID=A0ABT0D9A7_9HYPH|nr:efflux RND transporter periplasmic adaptor subunit [Ancylobacter crimeensis]MCK0196489.1 efflux RND transporter periplasmic adaptor subunit [Ancylobacter crimeensis]